MPTVYNNDLHKLYHQFEILILSSSHRDTEHTFVVKWLYWSTGEVWIKTYLENKLNHFSVNQTMNRFPIDMGDEVTSWEASFLGRTTILNMLTHQHTKTEESNNTYYKD